MTINCEYPRPMVTVDILLFRYSESELEILLIQRGKPPFKGKWAFPGGYVEMQERLLDAAIRELFGESGVQTDFLFPLNYADDPQRDPRGRTISFIFGGIISPPFPEARGGDDASRAAWFPLKKLPALAFDHNVIIEKSWNQLKHEFQSRYLIGAFLPFQFDLSDLENLFQTIFLDSSWSSSWLKQALEKEMIKKVGQNEFRRINSVKVLYTTGLFEKRS